MPYSIDRNNRDNSFRGFEVHTLFLNANRSKLMKKIKLEMAVVILIFLAVSIKALL